MSEERVYSVTECLPDDGTRCLCFGHETFCCQLDMEKEPQWHEVTFRFDFSEYKLKKTVPEDPEESILEYYHARESWNLGEPDEMPSRVIGVTKWKNLTQ